MKPEQVATVARHALEAGINERTLADLRAQFQGVHLSYCNDDDVINAIPYLQSRGLNIYLVDGREHCLTLTQDLDAATGLLLAEVSEDAE
ncbi:MAG TPA: DUF6129 family protein [Pirellulales bacterium]|nr:DUF6129 family protein [Pirellulales bacterium]